MTQSLSIALNQILDQDAESVLVWVQKILAGTSSENEEFNWLLLADVAALNARTGRRNDSGEFDIKWAEVAIAVYDRLASLAEEKKTGSGESLRISLMMLRAAAIARFGAIAGDPVLDINLIVQWFWKNLTLSHEEVEKKVANWRSLDIEQIRELRQLKNRLKVISTLVDSGHWVGKPEIEAWLSLRERLP